MECLQSPAAAMAVKKEEDWSMILGEGTDEVLGEFEKNFLSH